MAGTSSHRAASPGLRGDAWLVAAGCAALSLGLLVYLADRDPSRAWLVPGFAALSGRHWFGAAGQWLPSLLHPLAFGLLTAAALPARSAARNGACLAWGAVNIVFELGQLPRAAAALAQALQDCCGAAPWTLPLSNYFLRGTFDVGDIAAAALGTLLAIGVLRFAQARRRIDHAS